MRKTSPTAAAALASDPIHSPLNAGNPLAGAGQAAGGQNQNPSQNQNLAANPVQGPSEGSQQQQQQQQPANASSGAPRLAAGQNPLDNNLSVSGSLESVTSFAQTRVREYQQPNLAALKQEVALEEHRLSVEQVAAKFDTHLSLGLSRDLAKIRLKRNGPNLLTPPKPVSECYKFTKNLFSGFSLLLWAGALLCVGAAALSRHLDHLILGGTLAAVVLATGLFSYYQESKSSRIIEGFKKLLPAQATVIRDGHKDMIEASQLVLGDLVEVNAGDRVPADLRLVRVHQLRVDNSSLTGESEPQSRSVDKTNDNPLETRNLAFYSTNCVDGSAQGVVVGVGDRTIMGRIAGLTAQLEPNETPIAREIEHFIKLITMTACSIGLLFFGLALANNYHWLEALIFLIGVVVANVPEGLLATVTVCLTLTAKRMAARNCLVKNLEAVETLGSCSVICSDKTGTLTKNIMTVSHCWYDNHMFKCQVHDSRRPRLRDAHSLAWHCLTRAARLCSRARFRPDQMRLPIRRRLTTGDASESAILKWLECEFGQVLEYRDRQRKVAEITFNSVNKYALAIYDITQQRRLNHQMQAEHASRLQQAAAGSGSGSGAAKRSRSGSRSASNSWPAKRQQQQQQATPAAAAAAASSLATANNSGSGSNPAAGSASSSLSRNRRHRARAYHRHHPASQQHQHLEGYYSVQPMLDKLDRECRYLLVMKGAPERILERCDSVLSGNEVRPLDAGMRDSFLRAYESMGSLGERVMGFADLPLTGAAYADPNFFFDTDVLNFPQTGLRFLGLVSMIDPPRASVPDAVAKCREAGIRIIMVTGDHPITAQAIARSVGIISDSSETLADVAKRLGVREDSLDPRLAEAAVVHGNELRELSAQQLDELLRTHPEVVFARTSPQQKLSIVEACQRSGAIVAVTGDGVNDSPALKKADIGIAMGQTGSDVSKQAADLILMDDNFSSIVHGIEEGRLIFDNLKKSIAYTITSNVPELLPFLVYVVARIPLPLSTVCILLIDIVTDMAPAISLAYEKGETDIMRRRPRQPKSDRLVNAKLIWQAYGQTGVLQAAAGFFTYFTFYAEHGWRPESLVNSRVNWENSTIASMQDSYGQSWSYAERRELEYTAQSAFFVTIVVMQWGDLIISKTRKLSIVQQGMDNYVLNCGLILETVLTVMVVYIPFMSIFRLFPVRINYWLYGLPFALLTVLVDEMRKYLIRAYPAGWFERMTYY